jgi:hypothetical protein
MSENLSPAERFERELEKHEKVATYPDDVNVEVLDWPKEAYALAFHRAVVDHYLSCVGAILPGGIEGRLMIDQAELVCEAISHAAES